MVSIAGDGWTAEILISDKTQQDWVHAEARVDGTSNAKALAGAEWIMNNFGSGRTCVVRVPPEANTERLFDYDKTVHRGYVRFSWKNVPYHWYQIDSSKIAIPSLGLA